MPKLNVIILYNSSKNIDFSDDIRNILSCDVSIKNFGLVDNTNENHLKYLIKNYNNKWILNQIKSTNNSLIFYILKNYNKYFENDVDTLFLKLEKNHMNYVKIGKPISEDSLKDFNTILPKHSFIIYFTNIINQIKSSNLRYSNGYLYKMITKNTFQRYEKFSEFINNLNIGKEDDIIQNYKFSKKIVDHINSPTGSKCLPQYEYDSDLIEFNDCIYRISDGEILDKNEEYICYRYFKKNLKEIKKPKYWLQILKNSYDKERIKEFCREYAKNFRKHIPRDTRMYLLGKSQSGKTCLAVILEEFYQEDLCLLSPQKQFSLSKVKEAKLLLLEEFDSEYITRSQLLKMCEGGKLEVTKKFKDSEEFTFNIGMFFTSNIKIQFDDFKSGAFKSRINYWELNVLPEDKIDINIMQKIREEVAEVLIYCNTLFLE